MTSFDDFHKSLHDLVKIHTKNGLMIKMDSDLQHNMIRIFGENISSIERAKKGLEDVSEIAYTTAEHHPYWNLLYHASQISKLILEKWNDQLTKDEMNEITWSIDELKNTIQKIKENPQNNHEH